MGSSLETDVDLPVIDFAKWTEGTEEKYAIGKALADACHTVGFVYIINHGVSPALLAEAFSWSKRLFDLKLEEKMLAPHPPGPNVHRGYSWPGLEKVSQVISEDVEVGKRLREVKDCKESYEVGSEENEEMPNVVSRAIVQCVTWSDTSILQWLPENILPGYKAFMKKFYWECSRTSLEILKAMAVGMKLSDADFFLKFHSGHNK